MASKKPTDILLSKSDMSKEEISALSDAEAWKLIYSKRTVNAKDNRLQVCFTGFSPTKKEELVNLARGNQFKVMTDVTKKLDYLVGGENPGSKKIEKAEAQNVPLLNEQQFVHLIETGEVPSAT